MMKTGKNKCYKRIIAFLSVFVILFAGFNVGEVVLAADYITPEGYLKADHSVGYCNIHTESGTATCYIATEESEQKLHYYTLDGSPEMYNQEQVMTVTGDSIKINSGITLYVYSSSINDITVESGAILRIYDSNVNVNVNGGTVEFHGNSNLQMTVNSGDVIVADGESNMTGSMSFTTGTLTVNSGAKLGNISSTELANATVTNNGTIKFLSSFEDKSASFTNNGAIEAASVKITTTTFTDAGTATYNVKTGFEKGNFDLNGTIIPSNSALWDNEDVKIKSAGGKTVVKLDDVTITKTEAVDTTAGEFVPKPTITFAGWPTNIYAGQTINYKDYIQTDMGTATITFADATDSDGLVYGPEYSKAPTTAGYHRVTVTVPASTSYRAGSNSYIFNIKYLTGVGYCTVDQEPVKNDGYSEFYNTPVTLRAPDGFVIATVGGESTDLTSTHTISEDGYYMGQTGSFERVSDGARTQSGWLYPSYFVIDHTPPQIVQSSAYDQDGVAISTEIKNGVTLNARGVTFTIHDSVENFGNTLSSVTLDGEAVYVEADFGNAEINLNRTFPGKETHQIIAKDDLGNTSTWNITLNYLPTATPETPFTIIGSEGKNGYYTSDITLTPATGYTISSDVNGTFTDSLAYKPDMENVYLMDAAGLYTAPIPVSFLIDKTGPQFSVGSDETGNNYEIVNGLEVHAKKLSFSVSDDNLATVTVNGEAVDVVSGVANIELVPEAGNKGSYEIYAEDIAGNNIQATLSVEYLKEVATASVSVDAEYVGQKISPVLSTNSDGEAKFFYKRVGASDDTYVSEEPAAEGEYVVQVRIPATEKFTAATEEGKFKLKYLTAPSTAFSIKAVEGNNGFYKSDVELVAPNGFKIAGAADEKYKDSIIYTEGMDKIYLMRDDGALTGAIAFNEKYKIDKLTPEASKTGTITNNKTLKTKSIDIKNGLSIFADTLDFSIFDENLIAITINGESVEFNEKTAKILLDANNTTSKFNIVAEDKAGNKTSLSIVLKAAWLENNIIPAGAKITLEAGQVYNLEGGKWTVSGDTTVYYGGNKFCVDGSMDCIFTEKK